MAGWSWWLSGKTVKAKAGKDNDMKRMMKNDGENKRMAKVSEALSQAFGSIFGRNVPVVAVVDCSSDAEEKEKDFMKALEDFLAENEEDSPTALSKGENHVEPDDGSMKIPEGDGEEVFDEMLSDLLSFADMIEELDTVLAAVATGKMCPIRGISETDGMLDTVSDVLLKWAKYQDPEI